jgi:hypothetical protein
MQLWRAVFWVDGWISVTHASAVWEYVGMPLPLALNRVRMGFQASDAERRMLEAKAREAGVSVANYLRISAGLPERTAGRPGVEQLEVEQDQAWEILQGLGLDPLAFFPGDDSWLDEYR